LKTKEETSVEQSNTNERSSNIDKSIKLEKSIEKEGSNILFESANKNQQGDIKAKNESLMIIKQKKKG